MASNSGIKFAGVLGFGDSHKCGLAKGCLGLRSQGFELWRDCGDLVWGQDVFGILQG